jgi:hypothetical protein
MAACTIQDFDYMIDNDLVNHLCKEYGMTYFESIQTALNVEKLNTLNEIADRISFDSESNVTSAIFNLINNEK